MCLFFCCLAESERTQYQPTNSNGAPPFVHSSPLGAHTMSRAERHAARCVARAVSRAHVPLSQSATACSICRQRGDEPLFRDCACCDPSAGVHMTCLVAQAAAPAAESHHWVKCATCETNFFGATQCALAHARWKRAYALQGGYEERRSAAQGLANALANSRDYAAALPLFEELLTYGGPDTHRLISTQNLVQLHLCMQNPRLALPLLDQCAQYDAPAPTRLHTQHLRAEALSMLGDHRGALPLCFKTHRAREQQLGRHDITTLKSLAQLVAIWCRLGQNDKASAASSRLVRRARASLGREHPNTILWTAESGIVEMARCKRRGLKLLRSAGHSAERVFGPDAAQTVSIHECISRAGHGAPRARRNK